MATVESRYDKLKEEKIVTFRIPDSEMQNAEIGFLSKMAIKMNSESNSPSAVALSMLIILEGIEEAQTKKRRNVSKQN